MYLIPTNSIALMVILDESPIAISFLAVVLCLVVAEFIYTTVKLSSSGKPEEVRSKY